MNKTRALSMSAIVVIVGLVVLVLAGGSSATKARSSAVSISVRQTALGRVLVGTGGRTLYLFLADKHNVSKLSRAGFAAWPAFAVNGTPQVSGGVNRSQIETISSRGAKHQLTYAGHPLYYFVGDQHSGSTAGQGLFEFGAKWYVVSPNGKAITSAVAAPAPAPATPMPQTGGGGYPY
jgi:predicted lipoprotein with Yx(FWY)xxD motif